MTPRYIPAWALPQENLDNLMVVGAGAAPGIVYARGIMPADPPPDIDAFNMMDCFIILIEVGFYMDLGWHEKYTQQTDKYIPLLTALRR